MSFLVLVTGLLDVKNRCQAVLRTEGMTLALLGYRRIFGVENHSEIKCYREGESYKK